MYIMLNVYINFYCAFSCIVQHRRLLLYKYGARALCWIRFLSVTHFFGGHIDVN